MYESCDQTRQDIHFSQHVLLIAIASLPRASSTFREPRPRVTFSLLKFECCYDACVSADNDRCVSFQPPVLPATSYPCATTALPCAIRANPYQSFTIKQAKLIIRKLPMPIVAISELLTRQPPNAPDAKLTDHTNNKAQKQNFASRNKA